jgi:uncharacterized protein HemX
MASAKPNDEKAAEGAGASAASAEPGGEPKPRGGGATPQPATARTPSADPHERIDGLRAWLAQVDRRLAIRTYAIGAAVVLALAAGIVGVVLAISAKDESATKDDFRALSEQLEAVEQEATQAAEEEVGALTDRVDALDQQLSAIASSQRTTEDELSVVQDDIDDLRQQISNLDGAGADGTSDALQDALGGVGGGN